MGVGTHGGVLSLENRTSRCSPGRNRPGNICSQSVEQASLVKEENKLTHLFLCGVHASLRLVAPQGPRRLLTVYLVRLAASPCSVSWDPPYPFIPGSVAVNHPHAVSEGGRGLGTS